MTDITKTIDALDGYIDMLDNSGFLINDEEGEIAALLQKIRDYIKPVERHISLHCPTCDIWNDAKEEVNFILSDCNDFSCVKCGNIVVREWII